LNFILKEAKKPFRKRKEKRKIFVSRYWYFMSIGEISEKTGKTEKAIHNILSRTRKKLKKYIEERGFEI